VLNHPSPGARLTKWPVWRIFYVRRFDDQLAGAALRNLSEENQ
jgi:hypothetical protein